MWKHSDSGPPSLTESVSQIHLADISHKVGEIYIDSGGLSPDFNWRKWKPVLAQWPGVWHVYQQLNILSMWKDTDHYQWWLTVFTFDMKDLSPGTAKASKTNLIFAFQPLTLKQSSFFTIRAVTGPQQLLWPLTSPPWRNTNSPTKFGIRSFLEPTNCLIFPKGCRLLYSTFFHSEQSKTSPQEPCSCTSSRPPLILAVRCLPSAPAAIVLQLDWAIFSVPGVKS